MKGLAEVATVHPKKTLQMSPDITKNQFTLARREWECRNYLQSLCRTRKPLFELNHVPNLVPGFVHPKVPSANSPQGQVARVG